jgi:hypothetical protein
MRKKYFQNARKAEKGQSLVESAGIVADDIAILVDVGE